MKLIKLTKNKFASVDDEDFDLVSQFKWQYSVSKTKRAVKIQVCAKTTMDCKDVKMHRFLLRVTDPTLDVDHKNGNPLDNQKDNLRICTRSKNLQNSTKYNRRIPTSSKYKGVSWDKANKKWESGLQVDGKRKRLGRFISEIDAAKAYNEAAKKYFGEYAKLNEV